jgi:hypothetical protein
MLRWGWLTLALVAAVSPVEAGHASHWNTFGRKVGLGWSDGYHANNGCGQFGWVEQEYHGPAPVKKHVAPPAPQPAARTTREPVLPSQRSTPRPAYWNR